MENPSGMAEEPRRPGKDFFDHQRVDEGWVVMQEWYFMERKTLGMNPNPSKKIALIVTMAGSFLTPFMGSAVNIALPSIGREFAMDAVLLSWIPSAYLLAAAMFLVPFGRIADIYGRKKIFTLGILAYTVASFLSAIAPSGLFLIFFRILQGVGGSMIFGTGVAILTSIFSEGERGKVLGINTASVYLGLSLGPFIGGFLTEHLGWRSIFWINGILGILILAAVLLALSGEWMGAKGERFDFPGAIIYSFTLISTMYGFSLLPNVAGGEFIFMGILGLWIFVRRGKKMESPILDISLFRRSRAFTFSSLAALINYSATFGVGFLLSLFLQFVKGYSPLHAGSILIAQPAVQAIFSPFAGRLSDKIEPQVVASIGMAFTVAGLFLLTFLNEKTSLELIFLVLVFLGFGFALFSSPNTNAVMSSVEKKFYGVASGIVATMRLIGQMLSMGVITLIFALYLGRVQITPESISSFLKSARVAFLIFSITCFFGIFASLARGKIHQEEKPGESSPHNNRRN
jgi:EmrB/QacA subfamily drug resistance transporter